MTIIYQYDKRSGLTYAYESISYRDKETKKKRAKRKLIGRVDPETKELIATDGRNRKTGETEEVGTQEGAYYKALYEKEQKKCQSQEVLIQSLQNELRRLKG